MSLTTNWRTVSHRLIYLKAWSFAVDAGREGYRNFEAVEHCWRKYNIHFQLWGFIAWPHFFFLLPVLKWNGTSQLLDVLAMMNCISSGTCKQNKFLFSVGVLQQSNRKLNTLSIRKLSKAVPWGHSSSPSCRQCIYNSNPAATTSWVSRIVWMHQWVSCGVTDPRWYCSVPWWFPKQMTG